jgi:hypothetical protein
MEGHGLPGEVTGTVVTLPAFGAWFGTPDRVAGNGMNRLLNMQVFRCSQLF